MASVYLESNHRSVVLSLICLNFTNPLNPKNQIMAMYKYQVLRRTLKTDVVVMTAVLLRGPLTSNAWRCSRKERRSILYGLACYEFRATAPY